MSIEYVSPEEAFQEGDREAAARLAERYNRLAHVTAVNGPLDGAKVTVPHSVMAHDGAELPLELPRLSRHLVIPGERPRHAVYRVEAATGLLRFVRVDNYHGGI